MIHSAYVIALKCSAWEKFLRCHIIRALLLSYQWVYTVSQIPSLGSEKNRQANDVSCTVHLDLICLPIQLDTSGRSHMGGYMAKSIWVDNFQQQFGCSHADIWWFDYILWAEISGQAELKSVHKLDSCMNEPSGWEWMEPTKQREMHAGW